MSNEFETNRKRVLAMGEDGKNGSLEEALSLVRFFEQNSHERLLASALDVAYGLAPTNDEILSKRSDVLVGLAISRSGLDYRYVPAGTFLMGADDGDPDERPVHAVYLDEYWVADIPMTWTHFCAAMKWKLPPEGAPDIDWEENRSGAFHLYEESKIRWSYCETETLRAGAWHRHAFHHKWNQGGEEKSVQELFGDVPRGNPEAPPTYDKKPMVAVSWQQAEELCLAMSDQQTTFCLPSEAQWEKAARGGLIGEQYSWGSQPPNSTLCDFDQCDEWVVKDPRSFPPNGYGVHGMCGGIWEWTRDEYDALKYTGAPAPETASQIEKKNVLRGGSWVDCADAVRVAFRMCRDSAHWNTGEWGGHLSPVIGFRLFLTLSDHQAFG